MFLLYTLVGSFPKNLHLSILTFQRRALDASFYTDLWAMLIYPKAHFPLLSSEGIWKGVSFWDSTLL